MIWLQKFWVELVAAAICGFLVFCLGWSIGSSRKQHDWDAATATAFKKSAEEAAVLANNNAEIERLRNVANAKVISDRDAIIASLRNRPNRLPAAAAVTCAGSTGSELSRPDSEFLTRLAADADIVVANLRACYAREDEYRKAMIGNRKTD